MNCSVFYVGHFTSPCSFKRPEYLAKRKYSPQAQNISLLKVLPLLKAIIKQRYLFTPTHHLLYLLPVSSLIQSLGKDKMMLGKTILGVSALVLISYGVVCLISPTTPAGYAGLNISNGDAFAEIGAMYGGLQTGLGLFFLLAFLKPEFYRSALLVLLFTIGSLALGRLASLLMTEQIITAYTYGALTYEIATAGIAAIALTRTSNDPT